MEQDRERLLPREYRWMVAWGLIRALVLVVVLFVLYYELPLDHVTDVPLILVVGVVILVGVILAAMGVITRARHPGIRALEALAIVVPFFLLLFASAYFIMAKSHPSYFNTHPLTRTDTLYFTVTVFSTVGFGDISAASQTARAVVTAQMLLDLLAIALIVRGFIAAVRLAHRVADSAAHQPAATTSADETP